MTDPEDPSRLFESGDVPEGLRGALSAARADVGTDAQVAKLAERLGPLLGPVAPPAPAPAPVAATAAAGGAVKLGLAALALIAAGGGALLLSARQPSPPSAPITVATVAVPATMTAPVAPPLVAPAAPSVTEPVPAVSLAPKEPLPSKPQPPAQLSEAELLEQARSAAKSDPARALARANEHAARFPHGVLVQEREVLAIQALRQLGRTAEADKRAAAFAKAFPGSAFQRKLQH